MEKLKEKYWETIRKTRTSGRISPGVMERVEACWKKYDSDVVQAALEVHIRKYPGYKENYTLGIIRNMQRQKEKGIKPGYENPFNRFEQRNDIDFKALEEKLLAD